MTNSLVVRTHFSNSPIVIDVHLAFIFMIPKCILRCQTHRSLMFHPFDAEEADGLIDCDQLILWKHYAQIACPRLIQSFKLRLNIVFFSK